MERKQRERFERAVERKRAQARERANDPAAPPHDRGPLEGDAQRPAARERPPAAVDPRTKGSGHGQRTADKWNQ